MWRAGKLGRASQMHDCAGGDGCVGVSAGGRGVLEVGGAGWIGDRVLSHLCFGIWACTER